MEGSTVAELTPAEVLAAMPHRPPFRFVDEILELDDEHIVAAYRFPPDADFYRGHFPGRPLTPGVLLVEAMAQAAVVAHGLYLLAKTAPVADLASGLCLFTEASVEFAGMVAPGERVTTHGRKVFLRRQKLRSAVEMTGADGRLVCSGTLAGLRVPA
jgi:3-hydroxyacyl-[acyl-carrier-protein] dehydratase